MNILKSHKTLACVDEKQPVPSLKPWRTPEVIVETPASDETENFTTAGSDGLGIFTHS